MGRKQKIVSIEFGSVAIRICEMQCGPKPKIFQFLELEIPELAVSDGVISDEKMDELKTVIVEALKKNKIKTKKAIFTLFSSKIITREITLPEMKEKQLKQVIEENINDYFPIELEDYRVTHTKIDTVIQPDNSIKNKMLVIAAEKKLISKYETLAQKCRLTLIDVDYVGNSAYQAIKKAPRFEPKMYVKVEAENTLIMILEDDRLVLQRSMNSGLGPEKNDEDDKREAIRHIMGTISRVLHYYSGQSYNHLDKVSILGSGAEYVELFNELSDGLVTYEALINSDENIILKQDELKDKISDYIACIGAGISPVKLINYKPSIRRVNYYRASALMILLYAAVIISFGLMMQIPYLDALERNRDLKKLETFYSEYEDIYNTYVETQIFRDKFMTGDELTRHANDGLLDFILELEKKLPKDVTVVSLHSDDENIIMQMEVSTKEEAAGTIDTLRHFDSVMDVVVAAVSEVPAKTDEEELNQTVSFTIVCTYYPMHQDLFAEEVE